MGKYDFVKFFDADLSGDGPQIRKVQGDEMIVKKTELIKKDPVELTKAILEKSNGKIGVMHGEAENLEIKTDADFNKGVEMRGQVKTLIKKLVDVVEGVSKPLYRKYKAVSNLKSATDPLVKIDNILKKKTDDFALLKLLAQRKADQKAKAAAAALQATIDAEQEKIAAAERVAAKKEKRAAVIPEPIVVDVPVLPQTVAAKTEHGSVSLKMVLKGEITDLGSDFVFKMVLAEVKVAYRTLAETALKKAIKAGAVGIKGGPGVTVREVAETQHRRR
jgi:hypothetical protein